MRSTVHLMSLLAVAACTPNAIKGEIEGEKPKFADAIFIDRDDVYGEGDGIIQVYMTSYPDACETLTGYLEDLEDEDDPDGAADSFRERFPEEMWLVELGLRVDDPDADLKDTELDGVDWDEWLEEEDEAYGVVLQYTDHLDEDCFAGGECDAVETWVTDGGEMVIERHEPGERLIGEFETTLVEGEGDEEGEISILFDAVQCEDLEDLILGESEASAPTETGTVTTD